MKKSHLPIPLTLFFVTFFLTTESKANAIVPLTNLFTPETAVNASILTVVIILIEAFILRRWFRFTAFRLNLSRAVIINVFSSAAGSFYVWLLYKDFIVLYMEQIYFSMFVLTLLTETPILKFLYRRENLSWLRALCISLTTNFLSYFFLFVIQLCLFIAVSSYSDFEHSQRLKNWNDVSLLEGESGFIYTITYVDRGDRYAEALNRYDVEKKEWKVLDLGGERGLEGNVWDASDRLIAYMDSLSYMEDKPEIILLDATDLSEVSRIQGNFRLVRVSPDSKKIAVLERVREIKAPRDDTTAYMLGDAHKLKIYDVKSGDFLTESPRLQIGWDIFWSEDSSGIIFPSLRDETLFYKEADRRYSHTYGMGYAEKGVFPRDEFFFGLSSLSVSLYAAEGSAKYIQDERIVSPSGKRHLLEFPYEMQLLYNPSKMLVVSDPHNDQRKLIIETNSKGGARWVP